jgi:glycerol kinase
MNTGTEIKYSDHGLLTTAAWQLGPDSPLHYAVEGAVFCAGAAVQWLRDGLQLFESSPEIEALASSVDNSGDVVFVPALTGLGAPHWRAEARGLISGITRDTSRAHMARATLEGIALQCYEVLHAMKSDVGRMGDIRVDGGAAANNLLMQMQADLNQQTVVRPKMLETTAAGAAFLAGLGAGLFNSKEEIRAAWNEDRRFEPQPETNNAALLEKWNLAVNKA